MRQPPFLVLWLGCALLGARAGAALLLSDTFSYPDGVLTNVSSGKWVRFSGTGNDSFVTNGLAQVNQGRADDVYASLAGRPYNPASTSLVFYAGMDVTVSALPSRNGEYFAAFYAGSSGHKGRIYCQTEDAAKGKFRFAVAKGTSSATNFPIDLDTNTPHRLILRYDLNAASASLWVDPTDESDPNVAADDTTSPATILGFAFRQAGSEGILAIDNLVVGTSFSEALGPAPPNPPNLVVQPQGQSVQEDSGLTLSVLAGGDSPLTYSWMKEGNSLVDDDRITGAATAVLLINHAVPVDSGSYQVAVSNAAGTVTSSVASVLVVSQLYPPVVVLEPPDLNAFLGQSVTFSVMATGSVPLACQWRLFETNLPGRNGTNLTLNAVAYSQAGPYSCVVSNSAGTNVTRTATLSVRAPTLADLHTLLDSNQAPANTTMRFTQRGIVTTWANLTEPPDAFFFMQDSTAGIGVFYRGGATNLPPAGAEVEVTARLGNHDGLLELVPSVSDTASHVTVLSLNNPLPAPLPLDFAWQTDPALMEQDRGPPGGGLQRPARFQLRQLFCVRVRRRAHDRHLRRHSSSLYQRRHGHSRRAQADWPGHDPGRAQPIRHFCALRLGLSVDPHPLPGPPGRLSAAAGSVHQSLVQPASRRRPCGQHLP